MTNHPTFTAFDDDETINGPSLRQQIRCRTTENGVVLEFGPRQGTCRAWWSSLAIMVYERRPVTLAVPDKPRAATIEIPAR